MKNRILNQFQDYRVRENGPLDKYKYNKILILCIYAQITWCLTVPLHGATSEWTEVWLLL